MARAGWSAAHDRGARSGLGKEHLAREGQLPLAAHEAGTAWELEKKDDKGTSDVLAAIAMWQESSRMCTDRQRGRLLSVCRIHQPMPASS
jgi:hypothetical protein